MTEAVRGYMLMSHRSTDVTQLLQHLRDGKEEALDDLMKAVYEPLRRIAHNQLQSERDDHLFQTTELVHEAYEKLVDHHAVDWEDRQHFYAVAARAMRQILVDVARKRTATKRGGDKRRVAFDPSMHRGDIGPEDVVLVDDLLDRLADRDERMARVVECRFFGGYTIAETADVLGVSPSTVNRDWRSARAWLNREMIEHTNGTSAGQNKSSEGTAGAHRDAGDG
ncbi:ECF-type sigma factor [Longibacter sp.]|uniref:ECF-type sigma factor n=1 Tax=Longibacter sp. TaxID=2045415 RepID=UPI003EBE54E9